jgi:hypothetical protein
MAQRGPTNQDGRCAYLLHQLCNLRTMLDSTYRTTRKFKTMTKLINSKLLVQHACPVRKFKTRNWNAYSKPVPSASHLTLSFRPVGQRALARHILSLTCGTACEETDDVPNWLTPPLTAREKPHPTVFNRHFYLSIAPRRRTKCYNLYFKKR